MSKSEAILMNHVFTSKDFKEIKKESESSRYGDRENLFLIGKPEEEVVYLPKPARFYSPWTQAELYFNWMLEAKDTRSRRILTAYFFRYVDYDAPLSDFDYKRFKDNPKKTIIEKKEKELYFRVDEIPEDDEFHFTAEFNALTPKEDYEDWVVNGSDEDRAFVEKYGDIVEKTYYYLKKENMSHQAYRLNWYDKQEMVKKHRGKERRYMNTSITYQKKNDIRRLGERVTELCLLFSELDYYKLDEYKDKTQSEMFDIVVEELKKYGFPHPTQLVKPQGLHLLWQISPIPSTRYQEWCILQNKIHSILEKFGADAQTKNDKVRLLRLVGSIHEKTKQKVTGLSFSNDRFLFDSLLENHCAEEIKAHEEKRKKRLEYYQKCKERDFQLIESGKMPTSIKMTESESKMTKQDVANKAYHIKYLSDIFTLVKLRNGRMEGYREFICFLVRYWTLCLTDDIHQADREVMRIYNMLQIGGSYSLTEILTYTSSAIKAHARWKIDVGKGYCYRNKTLLSFFKLTREEMKHMKILIDEEEALFRKNERNAAYYEKNKKQMIEKALDRYYQQLEEAGKLTSKEQKAIKEGMIKEVLQENPKATNKEIAEITGIPFDTVKRYASKIRKSL